MEEFFPAPLIGLCCGGYREAGWPEAVVQCISFGAPGVALPRFAALPLFRHIGCSRLWRHDFKSSAIPKNGSAQRFTC